MAEMTKYLKTEQIVTSYCQKHSGRRWQSHSGGQNPHPDENVLIRNGLKIVDQDQDARRG